MNECYAVLGILLLWFGPLCPLSALLTDRLYPMMINFVCCVNFALSCLSVLSTTTIKTEGLYYERALFILPVQFERIVESMLCHIEALLLAYRSSVPYQHNLFLLINFSVVLHTSFNNFKHYNYKRAILVTNLSAFFR